MVLDVSAIIQSAILLFLVTDPLGNVPIFFSVTKNIRKDKKSSTIQNATVTALIVLMVFALGGNQILKYFQVSFTSFQIAGGALLFLIGFNMVVGKITQHLNKSGDFGVVPLGVPLIAGPGAITMTMIIAQTQGMLSATIAIMLSMIMMTLALIYCEKIMKRVGTKSSETLTRIMGMILAVIAVQFIVSGIQILF